VLDVGVLTGSQNSSGRRVAVRALEMGFEMSVRDVEVEEASGLLGGLQVVKRFARDLMR
jgi:hypothetical protein